MDNTRNPDDLSPARGILLNVALCLIVWLSIFLSVGVFS